MSKRQDPALRLMLVDDSVEEAEGIVSGLRNAGIAVRPLRPTTGDELTTMVVGQPAIWCWPRIPAAACPSPTCSSGSRPAARTFR
jgi:multidomain signaling protein FimX